MDKTQFTLGFQFGDDSDLYLSEEVMKRKLRTALKESFPNIRISWAWSDPNVQEVIGYSYEILDLDGNNHQKALQLKSDVYQIIGAFMGDFH
jgi:hypothetical protein